MTVRVVTKHPRYGAVGTDLSDLTPGEQRLAVLSGYARDESAAEPGTPTSAGVQQVIAQLDAAFARNDVVEVRRILAAEQAGQNRATVRKWADEHLPSAQDGGTE